MGIGLGILFLTTGCNSNSTEVRIPEETPIQEEVANMVYEYVTEAQTALAENDSQDLSEEDLIAIAKDAIEAGMNEEEIIQLAEDVGCEADILMQYINQ